MNPELFEVVIGKYYKKNIACPICDSVFQKPEEKRTDVNISIQLLGDCAFDKTDTLILISADSDLVPPIQFIKQHYPQKKIKVYFPPMRSSADIFNVMGKKVIHLNNNKKKFEKAILPHEVTINPNTTITIPSNLKLRMLGFNANCCKK